MSYTVSQFPEVEKVNERIANNDFFKDVIDGLSSQPKNLKSKYFYDQAGDAIFQEIMKSPEYYPSDCEMEIFAEQCAALAEAMMCSENEFDLVELGAGDATKTKFLLRHLSDQNIKFSYKPIDISENIINYLHATLPVVFPKIQMEGFNGDYLHMLKKVSSTSQKRKVVLLLGSSIGNMNIGEATEFCIKIRGTLSPGDMLLIGTDLRKNPSTILAAYNDKEGVTKKFNLNLLTRINREFGANFDILDFDHFPTYDPLTGACKSYLICLKTQVIRIGSFALSFQKDEVIDMEISQKYTLEDTRSLASSSGFVPVADFYDKKKWFLDTLWIAC
ncbi:L-histidine N(alpha)-methyltransferase [Mucilaginibacter sabulilitoris]|uniref:L-histidine N(Alpha)-methyltransferase n=1 Tax=Mucilaginibacter sabulilitoris TaxID=1173583 RepID=A0ABZ0TFJ7_9SPHI|nr:L-histidine N(alpha)-methyltransferase [Mucilaginibacter sabulilitoris]WPU91576.1 L-histidine N(alpha)-methyltransferase [Mucilaginibacter sabulilitoris]